MRYAVFLEPICEPGFDGCYYAHIPTLALTTHGVGIEAALLAARELAEVWIAEKRAHGEAVPHETLGLLGHIDLPDAILSP